jgi:hypothetical protein
MHRDWPCAQAKLRLTSRSFVITFGCTSFYAEQVQPQQTLNGPKLPNSPKPGYCRATAELEGDRRRLGHHAASGIFGQRLLNLQSDLQQCRVFGVVEQDDQFPVFGDTRYNGLEPKNKSGMHRNGFTGIR